MKYIIFSCLFLSSLCMGAASSSSASGAPTQVYAYDSAASSLGKAVNYVWKKMGLTPEEYPTDEEAQHLYATAPAVFELTYANARAQKKINIYQPCIEDPQFKLMLQQQSERADSIRSWLMPWIKEGSDNLTKIVPALLVLSAGTRTLVQHALAEQKKAAPSSCLTNHGFLSVSQYDTSAELGKKISDAKTVQRTLSPTLALPTLKAIERKVWKLLSSTYNESCIFNADEIEKSKNVYNVLFAFIRCAPEEGSMQALALNPTFTKLYAQYSTRVYNHNKTLLAKIASGSTGQVATIMEYHAPTIYPPCAVLAYEMLSTEEKYLHLVPGPFADRYISEEKPIGTFISFFCNSLSHENQQHLLTNKETILAAGKAGFIKAIGEATSTGTNDMQKDLLAEIKDADMIADLFKKLEELLLGPVTLSEASIDSASEGEEDDE